MCERFILRISCQGADGFSADLSVVCRLFAEKTRRFVRMRALWPRWTIQQPQRREEKLIDQQKGAGSEKPVVCDHNWLFGTLIGWQPCQSDLLRLSFSDEQLALSARRERAVRLSAVRWRVPASCDQGIAFRKFKPLQQPAARRASIDCVSALF